MTTPALIELAAPTPWHQPLMTAMLAADVHIGSDAALGVAVGAGREVPEHADRWSIASRAHLLVAVWDHRVEVGPWVEPGVGPCARCVEAATLDSRAPATLPSPAPALLALAGTWIARELRTWRAGRTPATWCTSWALTDDPLPTARTWHRHPYCGCAWWESA